MLTMRQEAGEVVGDDEIAALLHELCVSPQTEMAVLIEQMAAFVEFMEHRARDMVRARGRELSPRLRRVVRYLHAGRLRHQH